MDQQGIDPLGDLGDAVPGMRPVLFDTPAQLKVSSRFGMAVLS